MIPISYLRRHLRYDPLTGLLWWKVRKRGRRVNRPAGRIAENRYVTVGIDYQQYMAHHVIWALQTGKWPKREIDHKNRKMTDNAWTNLRQATVSQNRANSSLRKDNASGAKGVSWHGPRAKWRARCHVNGRELHLGLFTNFDDACAAYASAATKHFGAFAHAPR